MSRLFDENGHAKAYAQLAGEYRVRWFVGKLVVGGGHAGRIFEGDDRVFDVLDANGVQVFLVTPPEVVLSRVKK